MPDPLKSLAKKMAVQPFANQPMTKPNGTPLWHNLKGAQRAAMILPDYAKPPIRARAVRAEKGVPVSTPAPATRAVPTRPQRIAD